MAAIQAAGPGAAASHGSAAWLHGLTPARVFRRLGLPVPKAEVVTGPDGRYRIDFAFPEIRLAIEVDGWAAHSTPEQKRRDQRRLHDLIRSGWTVLRYDWWEVNGEPERVGQEIADAYNRLAA